jgi:hypothetical protein
MLVSPVLAATASSEQQDGQQNSQDKSDIIDYIYTNMTTEEYLAATGMTLEEFYSLPGNGSLNVESQDGGSRNSLLSTPETVQAYVIVDDAMKAWYEYLVGHTVTWDDVYMWAYNILENGDDPFWSQYEIDYNMHDYTHWHSTEATSMAAIFNEGRNTISKPSDCDVRIFLTGQHPNPLVDANGIGERPGNAFILTVREPTCPVANLWQHEASHNYDVIDHDPGLLDVCVMSYAWIRLTRDWCSSSYTTLYSNRFHFG